MDSCTTSELELQYLKTKAKSIFGIAMHCECTFDSRVPDSMLVFLISEECSWLPRRWLFAVRARAAVGIMADEQLAVETPHSHEEHDKPDCAAIIRRRTGKDRLTATSLRSIAVATLKEVAEECHLDNHKHLKKADLIQALLRMLEQVCIGRTEPVTLVTHGPAFFTCVTETMGLLSVYQDFVCTGYHRVEGRAQN